ncbi:hypothetical protein ACXYRQ_03820 [Mycoplasma sp. 394]|uniref:hypothetical protein n=1 Tax=Mycoplasma sp. 6243 TaxID=3440865 RepID=UPI003EBB7940
MNFNGSKVDDSNEDKDVLDNLILLSQSGNDELKKEQKWFKKNINSAYKYQQNVSIESKLIEKQEVFDFDFNYLYKELLQGYIDLKIKFDKQNDSYVDDIEFIEKDKAQYLIDTLASEEHNISNTTKVRIKKKKLGGSDES